MTDFPTEIVDNALANEPPHKAGSAYRRTNSSKKWRTQMTPQAGAPA